jgi:hypothetical protein
MTRTKFENFWFLVMLFVLSYVFTFATTVKPVNDMKALLEINHRIHVENHEMLEQLTGAKQ